MKNKKATCEIMTKVTEHACYSCKGVGYLLENKKHQPSLTTFDIIPCKTCEGTGVFVDKHYFLISGGFAIDMDTIK